MEFSVDASALGKQRSGCIVIGVYEGRRLSAPAMQLDAAARRTLEKIVARGDLEGELGTTLLLLDVPHVAAERVLLVGLGPEREFRESPYRTALGCATQALRNSGATSATICLNELAVHERDCAWKIEQAVLAIGEGMYRFDALKSKSRKPRRALEKISLHVADRAHASAARPAIARASAIAEGIALAKDLGNLPGNICTPAYLAQQARAIGRLHGFKVTVLERRDIERLRMGGLATIARGSRQPPKLIVMEYRGGARGARPVVLVGKGITFDSGGIQIKHAHELDEMKFDMCGAASVFGAMRAAALMKLPLDVVGIVPAAENMPGGDAIKPGDVVTTMSGQTVEVLDTDAEGRVVLCDALSYAEKFRPAVVVDIATLTGAIVTALGHVASGVFAKDDALAREVIEAGDRAWDRAWRMPIWDEYGEALESTFADFANIGPDAGDAIIAACFLARFTGRYPWVHLDIAGTASKGGEHKGATGRPVALLAHFLAARAGA